jgi:ATP-dependent exoDNAse (exonuclease V) beta subunit
MQLRRLGARAVNLFSQRELCEEAQAREADEELRLFHVAATRARERLLLSGVVNPAAASQPTPGMSVIERIAAGFEIDRERDSTIEIPPPEPRPGLDLILAPSELAVRVSLPSPERVRELTALHREPDPAPQPGGGPAPLVGRRSAAAPERPLSYTAISAHGGGEVAPVDSDVALREGLGESSPGGEEAAARGIAVHSLLEWSGSNGWREPPAEVVARIAASGEVGTHADLPAETLLEPLRAWLGSPFFDERVRKERSRAEVPLLVRVADTVLRGSIDLLVESDGVQPLIVDYKTDRVDGAEPAELARRYEIQQAIYALAVAEARGVERVDLAYVFLERPEEPVLASWGVEEIEAGRHTLEEAIARFRAG